MAGETDETSGSNRLIDSLPDGAQKPQFLTLEHEQKMARLDKHLELAKLNYKMEGE